MFSRINPFRFVAVVVAVFLMVAGLQSSATAATKRSLTISASPAASSTGTSVTFSGKISKSPKGTVVTIQRKSGGKWVKAASTRTVTSAGGYAVRVLRPKALGTYSYRATVAKKGKLNAATSKAVTVFALKRTFVSLSSNATSSTTVGSPVTLSGTVLPSAPGTLVNVQRKAGSSWVGVGTTTVSANGTFSRNVTPSTSTVYRALVARTKANAAGTSNERLVAARPLITTTSLPVGSKLGAYGTKLTAYGNAAGRWSAAPLPEGLVLNPSTGIISGSPKQGPDSGFTDTNVVIGFTETATRIPAATKTLTLRIGPAKPPTITTTSLPSALTGESYAARLTALGNPTGTWTAAPLPAGLTLDPATGLITGTPTTSGDTNVVVGFTQSGTGLTAEPKTLTLRVSVNDKPVISTTNLPAGSRLTPYSTTLTAAGSPAPVGTWSAAPLPDGLTLNPTTGVISGTPTTVAVTNVVVGFTSEGVAATPKILALTITEAAPPVISTANLPDGRRLSPYTTTLTAAGTPAPAGTWTASPLPAGLTLNATTGVISGTPTVVGTTTVVVGFTETKTGLTATPKTLTLRVEEALPPVIATTSLPNGSPLAPYRTQLKAVGDPAGTWAATGLPNGFTLNTTNGLITAGLLNLAATKDYTVTVKFTQTSTGLSATKVFTLKVG